MFDPYHKWRIGGGVPYLLNDVTNFVTEWHATGPSPDLADTDLVEEVLLADRFESLYPVANTAVKDCPKCGLVNSPNAMRCDCGWDFVARRQERSYLDPTSRGVATAGAGVGAVILVIVLIRVLIGLLANLR